MLTPEEINKIRNTNKNPFNSQEHGTDIYMQKIKSQLNILKLKGEVYHE